MKRMLVLLLMAVMMAGCTGNAPMQNADDSGRVAESLTRLGDAPPPAPPVNGGEKLDEPVPPRIEPNFPAAKERILMYGPGTVSEFTVSAHWIHGDGELIAAYVMIYNDTLTASQALTGICRTVSENLLQWTFTVDAGDLAKPGEYRLTVIGWDSYGLAAELTIPMELYWEE